MTHLCKEIVLWSPITKCDEPATRHRPHPWQEGVTSHYCAQHDPLRKEQSSKNSKQRKEDKKARWKAIEKGRR